MDTCSKSKVVGDKKNGAKRGRQQNFNQNEVLKLEELVRENFEVITSKLTNTITNAKKQEVWRNISTQISALGYAHRTEAACSDKWNNIKRKAKDEVVKEKILRRQTGGGACPGSSDQARRIKDMYADSASFNGIQGGMDSDEPDGLHYISKPSEVIQEVHESEVVTSVAIETPSVSIEAPPVAPSEECCTFSQSSKRPSDKVRSNGRIAKRSRSEMLIDYQIQYFKGMVERQALEKELLEVKLRVMKAAENKLNELNARDMLNILSEQ